MIDGKLDDHFPLVVWQTGSGTQTNMNLNEVIANRANETARRRARRQGAGSSQRSRQHEPVVERLVPDRDAYRRGQRHRRRSAFRRLSELASRAAQKEKAFANIVKIGRTHTQDATPLTLGQEFSGYAAQVESGIARLRVAVKDLYPLAQGGTAVGTGLNSKPKFARLFARHVAKITKLPFTSARQQIRGAGFQRRLRVRARRDQFGGDRPVQDRQRYPPAGLGSAFRPRRIDPARKRAGLVDHAGQGQPDPVRSHDHGLLSGVRQPHRRSPSPAARAISS